MTPPNRPKTMTGPNWATDDEAEPERVVGQLEDEPALGDLLHPRPDERDQPGRRRTAGSCGGGRRAAPWNVIVTGWRIAWRAGRRGCGAPGSTPGVDLGEVAPRGGRAGPRPRRSSPASRSIFAAERRDLAIDAGRTRRRGSRVARRDPSSSRNRSRLRARAASSSSSWPISARLNPASSRRPLMNRSRSRSSSSYSR